MDPSANGVSSMAWETLRNREHFRKTLSVACPANTDVENACGLWLVLKMVAETPIINHTPKQFILSVSATDLLAAG